MKQAVALHLAPHPLQERAVVPSVGVALNWCSVKDHAFQCTISGTSQDAASGSENYARNVLMSFAAVKASGNGNNMATLSALTKLCLILIPTIL